MTEFFALIVGVVVASYFFGSDTCDIPDTFGSPVSYSVEVTE